MSTISELQEKLTVEEKHINELLTKVLSEFNALTHQNQQISNEFNNIINSCKMLLILKNIDDNKNKNI